MIKRTVFRGPFFTFMPELKDVFDVGGWVIFSYVEEKMLRIGTNVVI